MPGIISDVIDDVTTWLVLDSEPTLSECCYTIDTDVTRIGYLMHNMSPIRYEG